MQDHPSSELSLATTAVALGFGKLMEVLVKAAPELAAISYIVAISAGLITIYFKIKNKN
jgi:hypothetical protein